MKGKTFGGGSDELGWSQISSLVADETALTHPSSDGLIEFSEVGETGAASTVGLANPLEKAKRLISDLSLYGGKGFDISWDVSG